MKNEIDLTPEAWVEQELELLRQSMIHKCDMILLNNKLEEVINNKEENKQITKKRKI